MAETETTGQGNGPQTPAGAESVCVTTARAETRGWINALLVRRKEDRGDLVGTIALWSFLAMLFALLLGGSSLDVGGLHLVVPTLDINALLALLGPIAGHVVKSTVESVKASQ